MSILIRDMEMPDSCFHCKISEVCQYYKAEHYANKRHDDCPLEEVPETHDKRTETHSCDLIDRQVALSALWKALYDYEDKTKKQFQESKELDVSDWIQHRIFVQNMNDIDRQTIIDLPSAQPELIRCKDCIFHGLCRTSTRWAVTPKDDWYCADAERRTDDLQ